MTIVDLSLTYTQRLVPFKTFAGPSGQDVLAPIGITWFFVSNAIAVKGAGDETHIRATMTFPSQYVYILKEFTASVQLTLGTTNNFSADGLIELSNCSKASPGLTFFVPIHADGIAFEFVAATAADPTLTYLPNPYKTLIERPGLPSSTWAVLVADEDAGATNVGIFRSVVCFYTYTIAQAQGSILNTPHPTMPF